MRPLLFGRIVKGQHFLRAGHGGAVASWNCSVDSLENCATEAVAYFMYSDGTERDGNSTPVQGFTKFLSVGFVEVPAHLSWAVYYWEL